MVFPGNAGTGCEFAEAMVTGCIARLKQAVGRGFGFLFVLELFGKAFMFNLGVHICVPWG